MVKALQGKLLPEEIPPDLHEDMEQLYCLQNFGWGFYRFHSEPEPYRRRMMKLKGMVDSIPPEHG